MRVSEYLLIGFLGAFLCSGCMDNTITVVLNPDGSGTLINRTDMSRATKEERAQFQERMKDPNGSSDFEEEKVREAYAGKGFYVKSVIYDIENLIFEHTVGFTDINQLLSEPTVKATGLENVDFIVKGDELLFTAKPDEQMNGMVARMEGQPKGIGKEQRTPFRYFLTIKSKAGDDEITIEQIYSKEIKKSTVKSLNMKGHSISRKNLMYNFADYTILPLKVEKIKEPKWSLGVGRRFPSGRVFEGDLVVKVPQDKNTYMHWESPTVMEGNFEGASKPMVHKSRYNKTDGDFEKANDTPMGRFVVPVRYPIPDQRTSKLGSHTVRIKALRSSEVKRLALGKIKEGLQHQVPDLKVTIESIDDGLELKLKGKVRQFKGALVKTPRGNVFELDQGSWSFSSDSGRVSYWESLPLEGAELLVDIYSGMEPVWLDLSAEELNLRTGAYGEGETGKGKEFKINPSELKWKDALKKKYPQYFKKEIKAMVDNSLKSEKDLENFIDGLPNEDVLSALVQFACRSDLNDDGRHSWFQTVFPHAVNQKEGFLESYQENLIDLIWDMALWKSEAAVTYFFSNSGMLAKIEDRVLKELKKGNDLVISKGFMAKSISVEMGEALVAAYDDIESWIKQKELLTVLDDKKYLPFFYKVFGHPNTQSFVRSEALNMIIKHGGDLPVDHLLKTLLIVKEQQSALQQIQKLLRQRPSLIEVLRPLRSVVEDICESKKSYIASSAKETLAAIDRLIKKEEPKK